MSRCVRVPRLRAPLSLAVIEPTMVICPASLTTAVEVERLEVIPAPRAATEV